jgi:hypothetical protein
MSAPRKSDAHFKVSGVHIGKESPCGTLTIEAPKASGAILVTYKPSYGRDYTLTLQEVCEMICWRVTKKEQR